MVLAILSSLLDINQILMLRKHMIQQDADVI